MKNDILIGSVFVAAILFASGCETQSLMQTSARSAADQLQALKLDVQAKARAEANYYRQEQKAMAEALQNARPDDFELLLDHETAKFAAAGKSDAAAISTFLNKFLTAWVAKETARQDKIDTVASQLAIVETTLDASSGKIDELLGKLRALSEAQSKSELAKFSAGFVKTAYAEFEGAKAATSQ